MFLFNNISALCTGIIGGADGPTAILVTSNPIDWVIIAVLAAVFAGLVALFAIKIKRRKKKYHKKTKIDSEEKD